MKVENKYTREGDISLDIPLHKFKRERKQFVNDINPGTATCLTHTTPKRWPSIVWRTKTAEINQRFYFMLVAYTSQSDSVLKWNFKKDKTQPTNYVKTFAKKRKDRREKKKSTVVTLRRKFKKGKNVCKQWDWSRRRQFEKQHWIRYRKRSFLFLVARSKSKMIWSKKFD